MIRQIIEATEILAGWRCVRLDHWDCTEFTRVEDDAFIDVYDNDAVSADRSADVDDSMVEAARVIINARPEIADVNAALMYQPTHV